MEPMTRHLVAVRRLPVAFRIVMLKSVPYMMRTTLLCIAILTAANLHATDDILVADFEGANYGQWKVTGEAFGSGPARGTLPGQMHVDGFKGKGLVNSFHKGDDATGTLTSPPFKVERKFISFLIGGGKNPDKSCMNLLIDGKFVRNATGSNDRPGGSEVLAPDFWDVSEFAGKTAVLQIVDQATGGWGHITVDQVVQTDVKPKSLVLASRENAFTVAKKYLVIPIKNGAQITDLVIEVDGRPVRRYGAELATDPENVDWYAFLTIESYQGKAAKVKVARATVDGFALVRQADTVPGAESWYSEALRPQFHFTQAVGWNNDPNGMVYLDSEWHLFFQHNPVGWNWGNMTWGHAVSKDLVHWQQLPDALFPKTMAVGDCFSGGATVDAKDTTGWKTGTNDVVVAFLTDTGAGEAAAYSNDRGRTFTWHKGNPVVKHSGRDPKVVWYPYSTNDQPLNARAKELGGHWVMAVYDEHPVHKANIAFYTSVNLKEWQEQSHLPGYYECPEFFELRVDADRNNTRWVVLAADAKYALGRFDGRTFTPEHRGKHQVHWGAYYASQTFNNAPDGRRIQIGWVRIDSPNMPFNQTFSFPHELTLRSTDDGLRMFAEPVGEIDKLHKKQHTATDQQLAVQSPVRLPVSGELFDIRATFELGDAKQVGLDIGGNRIVYDVAGAKLNDAPLKPVNGKVTIQVLVDRPMMEIIGNNGRVFITAQRKQRGAVDAIEAYANGGAGRLVRLEVHELKSIWEDQER